MFYYIEKCDSEFACFTLERRSMEYYTSVDKCCVTLSPILDSKVLKFVKQGKSIDGVVYYRPYYELWDYINNQLKTSEIKEYIIRYADGTEEHVDKLDADAIDNKKKFNIYVEAIGIDGKEVAHISDNKLFIRNYYDGLNLLMAFYADTYEINKPLDEYL